MKEAPLGAISAEGEYGVTVACSQWGIGSLEDKPRRTKVLLPVET